MPFTKCVAGLALGALLALCQPVKKVDVPEAVLNASTSIQSGTSRCSGTIVGPRAVLTATHCEFIGTRPITIAGQPVKVELMLDDGQDHRIVFLSGVRFSEFTRLSETRAKPGETVWYAGTPGTSNLLLRKGYVAGPCDPTQCPILDSILLDINGYFGDSGAGVYNEHGALVGVVHGIVFRGEAGIQWKMMVMAYPQFPKEVFEKARTYGRN